MDGPDATADGTADFGLTNSIVAACWHGYFTGNVGTLKVLVDYPYPTATSTRKAVSIGGGSVSLPSSFTLSVSPTTPKAGEDLIITATAQTIAGVPQAGVTVTITISSGPDAGQTLTGVTDSLGVATITVRTSSQGTAVYTATATVNGVAKTVSATVTWDPPASTTTIPTTTLAPSTTVAIVAPTPTTATPIPATVAPSTTAVEIIQASPTTVVVDPATSSITVPPAPPALDAPEEQHMPQTGVNTMVLLLISFQLIILGYAMVKNNKSQDQALLYRRK